MTVLTSETVFFPNGGWAEFNHVADRTLYRIRVHRYIGSHPDNPDIQNVTFTCDEGLCDNFTEFRHAMQDCKSVEDAFVYLKKEFPKLDPKDGMVWGKKV
jgi:hypothetical protein